MLILKGSVEKTVVVGRLSQYKDTIVYGYTDKILNNIEGILQCSPKDISITEFCHSLEKDVSGKNTDTVIVYTNLSEEEITPIKNVIESLEKENFQLGIVTCRQ